MWPCASIIVVAKCAIGVGVYSGPEDNFSMMSSVVH